MSFLCFSLYVHSDLSFSDIVIIIFSLCVCVRVFKGPPPLFGSSDVFTGKEWYFFRFHILVKFLFLVSVFFQLYFLIYLNPQLFISLLSYIFYNQFISSIIYFAICVISPLWFFSFNPLALYIFLHTCCYLYIWYFSAYYVFYSHSCRYHMTLLIQFDN